MSKKGQVILTIIPQEKGEEFLPENIVVGNVKRHGENSTFVNFKYLWTDPNTGKTKRISPKVLFPILPVKMYERYNTNYDTVTQKSTVVLNLAQDEDGQIQQIMDKLNVIQERQDELLENVLVKELKSDPRMAMIREKDTVHLPTKMKQLTSFLFFYEKDKEGNPIDNPGEVQYFSIKIEPKRDWLAPSVSILHSKSDNDDESEESAEDVKIPAVLTYKNPRTGEITQYRDLSEKDLQWYHLLDVRTQSSVMVNFDSFSIMIKKQLDVEIHRRTFLAHNAIADFAENSTDDFGADFAQDMYGNDEKVNPEATSKLARLAEYSIPSEDKDDFKVSKKKKMPKEESDSESESPPPSPKKKASKKSPPKEDDSDSDSLPPPPPKKKAPKKKASKEDDSDSDLPPLKKKAVKKKASKEDDSDSDLPPPKKKAVKKKASKEDDSDSDLLPPKKKASKEDDSESDSLPPPPQPRKSKRKSKLDFSDSDSDSEDFDPKPTKSRGASRKGRIDKR